MYVRLIVVHCGMEVYIIWYRESINATSTNSHSFPWLGQFVTKRICMVTVSFQTYCYGNLLRTNLFVSIELLSGYQDFNDIMFSVLFYNICLGALCLLTCEDGRHMCEYII